MVESQGYVMCNKEEGKNGGLVGLETMFGYGIEGVYLTSDAKVVP